MRQPGQDVQSQAAASPAPPAPVSASDIPPAAPLDPAVVAASPIPLDSLALARLARFRDLLLEWNARFNLTAIADPAAVERVLILDALRMAPHVAAAALATGRPSPRLVDIGTGGGFPGVPLAIALPHVRVALVDATAKKVGYLQTVAADLRLGNVTAHQGRAEELGHDPAWRGRFDLATARAVASLSALMELVGPLLRVGGVAFFPKGPRLPEEQTDGAYAASQVGARIREVVQLPHDPAEQVTNLVMVDKIATTPARYPRRTGLPGKEPLTRGPAR
jgi:16S rRNA (guanine527-N7)-methyltransferase